jgi:hypothetical protein
MLYVTLGIGIILVTVLPEAESQQEVPTDEVFYNTITGHI